MAGKETVMIYMQDLVASNARPVQQLIAFEKTNFEANERKTIRFTITEQMLRFWNNENKFVSEPGEFKISTGYADHLVLTKTFYLILHNKNIIKVFRLRSNLLFILFFSI